jgi:hypothetical protein
MVFLSALFILASTRSEALKIEGVLDPRRSRRIELTDAFARFGCKLKEIVCPQTRNWPRCPRKRL